MTIGTGGISPQGGAASTLSFIPPISPAISGSPGVQKILRSDSTGVVTWLGTILKTTFNTSSTWTPSPNAVRTRLHVLAAGGGGGGGRRDNAASQGGNGGEGGGYTVLDLDQATVSGFTWDVTVGAGGAGGAAQTSDSTDGGDGGDGGASFVSRSAGSIILALARAGKGGEGGKAAASTQVYGSAIGSFIGGAGAISGTALSDTNGGPGGGGGGGSHDGAIAQPGTKGTIPVPRPATRGTGGAINTAGTAGNQPLVGTGPGSGGGGGGASKNGFNSGGGGVGGSGRVWIEEYF